jgi:hypothetical protein
VKLEVSIVVSEASLIRVTGAWVHDVVASLILTVGEETYHAAVLGGL